MKRDLDNLNLRDAFGPMPEETYDALMKAACSVKEEEPVRKVTFRAVLIAACIIMATMAVAIAASNVYGWTDFYTLFYGTSVPQAAQDIMAATEEKTFTLGPVTYRVQQLYADRHIAMSTVQVTMTDSSPALICMDTDWHESIGVSGENGEALAKKLGVDKDATWIDAAKQLNLPLYGARAILDMSSEYIGGEEMEDVLYDADDHLVYYSMQMLNSSAVKDTIETQMFLRIAEVDLETGEEKSVLKSREDITLDVAPVLAEHNYQLKNTCKVNGLTLKKVHAELTPAGLYLYTDFTADEGMTEDDFYEMSDVYPAWYDGNGNEYGMGLNLSYESDASHWPEVSMTGMISVDSIPDTLIMEMTEDSEADDASEALRLTLTK